ncbi:MAG: hypothetical protein R6W86_11875 [Marinobacter sp.]|uniref:hypothetical protein n=1 Tax=Marinobacter sp. TaxID=50741 RepID=UPI00396E8953
MARVKKPGAAAFGLLAMHRCFQVPVSRPVAKNGKAALRQIFSASVIVGIPEKVICVIAKQERQVNGIYLFP